jgi:hypothetical protein
MRIALVAALGLAAPAAATAWSRPSVDPPTVSCNKVILRIGTPAATANGYRVILGSVSVPPAFQQQVVRTGERPWTHYRKAGLVVRGNSLPVYVTVPKAWRGRAAITWGNSGTTSALRIARCPPYQPRPWNVYAGGFLLRSPKACVPLEFRHGNERTTVRFGLGKRCGSP